MATLAELARQHTRITKDQIGHLQRLVSDWGMLADLCFGDVLLYLPTVDGRWVVLDHVRPVTSQTIYVQDWIGSFANESRVPLLQQTYRSGTITEGEVGVESLPVKARMRAIPVRANGEVIGVITREWSPTGGRQPGELERTYAEIFARLVTMISDGTFPYPDARRSTDASPRVGDGAVLLDESAKVMYASPNAVSALHRAGINANAVGLRLSELGFNDTPVRTAFDRIEPVLDEFEQTPEVTLLVRCLPLLEHGKVTGALMLLRDVSELRRRDRMLLSKDATIREIHHRVKNNLQTISSLLRLQGRRLTSPEAKEAIDESVRRIRTIALVHETLSREAGDDVPFIDIVRPLTRMAEEGLQSPDRPVRFRVLGDGGKLPATIATPLAVVLTELLQNAVDHAFNNDASGPGSVAVQLRNDGELLWIDVVDDGAGLPEGFNLDTATGLGLSIVRTLVTTELAGTIDLRPARPADLLEAQIATPQGPGTVVSLSIPVNIDR